MPEKSPKWLKSKAIEYLLKGGNRAQIVNDKAVVKALVNDNAMPLEHARNFMCGGCMELSSFGKSGDMLFAKFFNTAKVLEYVLTGGICLQSGKQIIKHLTRDLTDFSSFEEFYDEYINELAKSLELTFRGVEIGAKQYAEYRPAYYLSSLIEDCIGRGRTINAGGALYEDIGIVPMGLPNVADSLTAIRIAVFKEKILPAKDLLYALAENFERNKVLRQRLNSLPKYGHGNVDADQMMSRVVKDVCNILKKRKNSLGGSFKPMIMTFRMASVEGGKLGASADGRIAGTPIAQGITPQSRAMKDGLSSAMSSALSLPVQEFTGGASHIWDIDKALAKEKILSTLVEVFFQKGGQMFQGNVSCLEQLKQAQKDPGKHPGLTVRVGGYSAIFTDLDKPAQDEIINRLHHSK